VKPVELSGTKEGISEKINDLETRSKKNIIDLRRSFKNFVDWRRCAAVMQRKMVTVKPSCSGGDNVVVE
jgi:hypothetical protein